MRRLCEFAEIDWNEGLPKAFDKDESWISTDQEERGAIGFCHVEDQLSEAVEYLNGKRAVVCTTSSTSLCKFERWDSKLSTPIGLSHLSPPGGYVLTSIWPLFINSLVFYFFSVSLWRRTNARSVRLFYSYWQYTDLFMYYCGFVRLVMERLAIALAEINH